MERKDILFFAGIKHSGKTTMAKLCAQELGIQYHDGDDILFDMVQDEYTSVREFYKAVGPQQFMAVEAISMEGFIDSMAKLSQRPSPLAKQIGSPSMIISLGGGACDNPQLMDIVKRSGTCCYLANDPAVLLGRILRHGVPPFLDADDIEGSFQRLYQHRDDLYRNYCDIMVTLPDCADPRDTCNFLLKTLIQSKGGTLQ